MRQIKISNQDLGTIISGIYYGGDEDLSNTEDLIDYLTDEENEGHSVLNIMEGENE